MSTTARDDPRCAAAVLLRVRDVADLIGVHPRTVAAWVAAGEFPGPIRIGPAGRTVRWRFFDVEAWIEQHSPVDGGPD